MHKAVSESDVVDNLVTNGTNSESHSTGCYSFKQHILGIALNTVSKVYLIKKVTYLESKIDYMWLKFVSIVAISDFSNFRIFEEW